MSIMHCAYADQLGKDLIEAYRRVEETDIFTTHTYSQVTQVQDRLATHRLECPFCNQIMKARHEALQVTAIFFS